jgi:hypothetical protein
MVGPIASKAGFPKLRTTMNMSTCPLSHKICCPMLDAFYVFFYHGDLRKCGIMMDSVEYIEMPKMQLHNGVS